MRASRLQSSVFAAYWLLGIGEMTRTYFTNPYDPTLQGTAAYGHTAPGELNIVLTIVAVEFVVFGAILRPWSYRRSWARSLIALIVLTPWLLISIPIGLHAGPTTQTHVLWLMLLWIGLLALTLVSVLTPRPPRVQGASPAA